MLSEDTIDEIRRLLAVGRLSQRQIAAQLGVSRGVVGQIAQGKRTTRRAETLAIASPRGPLVRCPQCGGLVRQPCLACQIRQMIDRRTLATVAGKRRARRSWSVGVSRVAKTA